VKKIRVSNDLKTGTGEKKRFYVNFWLNYFLPSLLIFPSVWLHWMKHIQSSQWIWVWWLMNGIRFVVRDGKVIQGFQRVFIARKEDRQPIKRISCGFDNLSWSEKFRTFFLLFEFSCHGVHTHTPHYNMDNRSILFSILKIWEREITHILTHKHNVCVLFNYSTAMVVLFKNLTQHCAWSLQFPPFSNFHWTHVTCAQSFAAAGCSECMYESSSLYSSI